VPRPILGAVNAHRRGAVEGGGSCMADRSMVGGEGRLGQIPFFQRTPWGGIAGTNDRGQGAPRKRGAQGFFYSGYWAGQDLFFP